MCKKYGYMIKTINKDGTSYNGFKYPLKKGAKVEVKDWNCKPKCGGGIYGLIHETKYHYIENKELWIILKYEKGTEVIIDDEKIKVPYAWVVDWGEAGYIQNLFEKLTGKKYEYDYAIQTAGYNSTQKAGNYSTQTAGYSSTQTAGNYSAQTARNDSIQKAGIYSTQKAGSCSTQTAGDESIQKAGDYSTQTAGDNSTQTAGDNSTQTAGSKSTQRAGNGSISIIRGMVGYCKHKGKVLQILVFYDNDKNEYIYLTKIITDNKKHKLEAVENERGEWELKDIVINE